MHVPPGTPDATTAVVVVPKSTSILSPLLNVFPAVMLSFPTVDEATKYEGVTAVPLIEIVTPRKVLRLHCAIRSVPANGAGVTGDESTRGVDVPVHVAVEVAAVKEAWTVGLTTPLQPFTVSFAVIWPFGST